MSFQDPALPSSPAIFAQALVEGSPDALISLSVEGRILYWNRGAAVMFGYSSQEALGMLLEDLIIPKEFVEESRNAICKTTTEDTAQFETVRRCKDGSLIHIDVSKRLVRDEQGKPRFIVSSKKNITSLRKAQLAETERLKKVLEATPDAMVLVDRAGCITLINAQTAKLFGYTSAQLVGKPIEMLIPERYRKQHPMSRDRFFEAPVTRPMGAGKDLAGLRQDGSEFSAEISLSSVEVGQELFVIAAIRNISDRKRIDSEQRQKILEANRLKSEFLANMSHELRTPLNAIIGFATLIHKEKAGPVNADQKEYLGDILTSSRHLLQLINDILDLAKIESGKMEFHPEQVDMSSLITEVLDTLRGLAAEKWVKLQFTVEHSVRTVRIDPSKLKQVLYNYLSNAIKFSLEGGVVRIVVSPEMQTGIRIEVFDQGIGIAPENLPKLFIEFQQLNIGLNKQYQGTGLGLAYSKRIVEAQGGMVKAVSTLGQGSVFTAILPHVLATPGQAAETNASDPSRAPKTPVPRVLVVEQDPAILQRLTSLLERNQYAFDACTFEASALDFCQSWSFSAVVFHLPLRGSASWKLMEQIRATPLNRDVPAIIVSPASDSADASGVIVDHFMIKPVLESELLAQLQRHGLQGRGGLALVVDDDPSSQRLLSALLKHQGIRVVCTSNGLEALLALEQEKPNLIIVDLLMPLMQGDVFVERLRSMPEGRDIPVIIWTVKELLDHEREKLMQSTQRIIQKNGDGLESLFNAIKGFLKVSSPQEAKTDPDGQKGPHGQ